jgi:hypothetical protein
LKFNSVFDIHKLQPFFPPIEQLFKTEILDNPVNYAVLNTKDTIANTKNNILSTKNTILNSLNELRNKV